MVRDGYNCYFSFWEKMKKTPGDIILHISVKNYDQMMYSCEIWCATDGETDRKIGIWRWVPHEKIQKKKYLCEI